MPLHFKGLNCRRFTWQFSQTSTNHHQYQQRFYFCP